MQAAMCGFLPGLIFSKEKHVSFQPVSTKIAEALQKVTVSENLLHWLIKSMFDGQVHADIPDELLFFVDSLEVNKIRWLPIYLYHLFSRCLDLLPSLSYLKNAVSLYLQFESSRIHSGKSWEALFVLTLLLRCNHPDLRVVPFLNFFPDCDWPMNLKVSYNSPEVIKDLVICTSFEQIKKQIDVSEQTSHLAIIYPPNSQFKDFDCFVIAWNEKGEKNIFAFQLKDRQQRPTYWPNQPPESITKAFLVHSQAPANDETNEKWVVLSQCHLEDLYGVSGYYLTPFYLHEMGAVPSSSSSSSSSSPSTTPSS
uniref:Uncharacterized protein n=1 Tax=Paramoeba aestuarina TaxID=180227 RepID=A0A7S4NN26_9EUKA